MAEAGMSLRFRPRTLRALGEHAIKCRIIAAIQTLKAAAPLPLDHLAAAPGEGARAGANQAPSKPATAKLRG
jgi:hypothetical protein